MLKRVIHSLGLVDQHNDKKDPRRKSKFVVKIVHEGGEVEVYQHAIYAYKLMAKYPGMFVAKPEVFTVPHKSVLLPEEPLFLGHKYIIISCGKVEKLKHKHAQKGKIKETSGVVTQDTLEAKNTKFSPKEHKPKENGKNKISVRNEVAGQEMMETRITLSTNGCKIQENSKVKEENVNAKMNQSFCSAKEFHVPREKTTRYSRRKGIKGKNPFVPPLPEARSYRGGLGWQPSLPTVKEISPGY